MALPDPALRAAARRAYEGGRLRHAVGVAWPALLMVGAAAPFATDLRWHAVAGLAMIVCALWLGWRGGAAGRAVRPALLAGVVPLVLPLVTVRALCAYGSCSANCMAACLVGGGVAGAWFGLRAGGERARGEFLAAGALVAGLAGSLGCAFVGAAGMVGMVAAFAGVATPVVLARRVAG